MASEEDEKSTKSKRYVRVTIVFAFLLALFWPLGSFFFWIFFGGAFYFGFLAYYHHPRSSQKRAKANVEFDRPAWHARAQGKPIQISQKKIKLIVLLVSIAAFFIVLVSVIIGLVSSEIDSSLSPYDAVRDDRELLTSDPTNLDALTNIGNSHYANGQLDSALLYYEKVLKVDPQNSSGLYNKGLTYYAKEEYQKSIELLRLCISLHPDNLDAYMVLGDNYYSQNQYPQALSWYKQAYYKGARTSGLLNVMAYVYDQQNQQTEAIRFYKEALQLDSGLVEIYSRLSELEPDRAEWYKMKAETWK